MIYLDNAATSWPKPEAVYRAVEESLRAAGNPGRGVNQSALGMSRKVFEARTEVAAFFNVPNEERVVFTKNVTEALNIVLKGFLQEGDHVLISPVEHNSVVRPLEYLKETKEISYDIIPGDKTGTFDVEEIDKLIRENTKMIVTTHSSNVLGTILPVQKISKLAQEHNIYYMIDAAQTAGILPIDVQDLGVHFLAFTGHKSLLGPQGTGGLVVNKGINLQPLVHGGTGTNSKVIKQTGLFPDDFESGTQNVPGIAGLLEGIRYCGNNLEVIRKHELLLMEKLMDYLVSKPEIEVYGPVNILEKTGLVTFNVQHLNSANVGQILDQEYQISTRTGLHCSPLSHEAAGTLELGGVRVSVGPFTKEKEIDALVQALNEIT